MNTLKKTRVDAIIMVASVLALVIASFFISSTAYGVSRGNGYGYGYGYGEGPCTLRRPSHLEAIKSRPDQTLFLRWEMNDTCSVDHYRVRIENTVTGAVTFRNTPLKHSLIDYSSLSARSYYRFSVRAVYDNGVISPWSPWESFTTFAQ